MEEGNGPRGSSKLRVTRLSSHFGYFLFEKPLFSARGMSSFFTSFGRGLEVKKCMVRSKDIYYADVL